MFITMLASGSGGNSTYIWNDGTSIFVDCGISMKDIECRLYSRGLDIENVDGIVISHGHIDHYRGAVAMARKYKSIIYASKFTFDKIRSYNKYVLNNIKTEEIKSGDIFCIKTIKILAFGLMHDIRGTLGFLIKDIESDRTIGIATDFGIVTNRLIDYLSICDLIVMESNHDIDMLKNGLYPYFLKERILSNSGHISNLEAMNALYRLKGDKLRHVIFAHVSKENNSEFKIKNAYYEFLVNSLNWEYKYKVEMEIASQEKGSNIYFL